LVARRVAFADVLDLLARLIEQQTDGLLCSILLADPDNRELRIGAAPNVPSQFRQLLENVPIGPNVGSCGTAAYRRETVVIADIASDPLCADFVCAALDDEIRACWSTPFFSTSGRVLGTVAMYDRTPRTPSPEDLLLVEQAATVTGLVVEREELEKERARLADAVAAQHATLSAVLASMSDGLVTVDSGGRIVYCNGRAGDLLQIEPSVLIGADARALFTAMEQTLARPMDVWAAALRSMSHLDDRPVFELTTAGPAQRDIAVQFFPVIDEQDQLLGTGIVLRDVTQSRRLAMLHDRERIAMDLHDGIVQSLYGLALGLGARDRVIPERWIETRDMLQHTISQINAIIRDIRVYISALQPERVLERDLRSGLAALTDELRVNGLLCPQVEIDAEVDDLLDSEVTGHLLYVAHEAASNIIRHASASAATIRLLRAGDHAHLVVADDGRGFVPHRTGRRTGDGLRNMAERAAMIGGDLSVNSAPGRGTEVRVQLPLPSVRTVK
jgi:signal transduction histidine kinase